MKSSYKAVFPSSAALLICGVVGLASSAVGGGTVTNYTQSDLQAALAGGGTVLFAGNGTIILSNTLVIAQDTVLDANGNKVSLSGGNVVRLFQVASNVNYWVKG